MWSTVLNYNELKVLPFKLIYTKFAILWAVKNINVWYNINTIETKRKDRAAYNAPVVYTNTSFGQTFLDYIDPTCFNSTNNESKERICITPKYAKKIITDRLYINMYRL